MKGPWLRRAAVACALSASFTLSGCDTITSLVAGVDGTYVLASINGQNLPVIAESGFFEGTLVEVRITAGELELEDEQYEVTISFDVLADGSLISSNTETDSGAFEVDGDQIILEPGTTDAVVGRIDGNEVRFTVDGDTLVFERD